MNKSKLREIFKEKLHNLKLTEKENIEELILKNLISLLEKNFIGINSIGLYIPLKDEYSINLNALKHYEVSFAQLNDTLMEYKIIPLDRVEKLSYNDHFDGEISVPEVLFIPALAFSKKGYRLGRGAGYFDRYLKDYQGVKVGVCSEFQVIDFNDFEDHDIPVDYLITELNIYKIEEDK